MSGLLKMVSSIMDSLESLETLQIDSSRCIKIRSPLSMCNSCIDICPVQGIKRAGYYFNIANCIQCGLCASVCPTGCVHHKNISNSQIIERVEGMLDNFQEIYLYCSNNRPENNLRQGIEVPCLGIISWECWLYLIITNKVKIIYAPEKCSNCLLKGGQKLIIDRLTEAETMINKTMSKVPEIINDDKTKLNAKANVIDQNRRNFLGSVFNSLVKTPEKLVSFVPGLTMVEEKEKIVSSDAELPEKHQILVDSLKKDNHLREKIYLNLPNVGGNCRFCKVCSTLCPQNALEQRTENNNYHLILDKFRCNSCGFCVDVCYHQAINLKPLSIKELDNRSKELAVGTEYNCPECGIPYKASYEDNCPACKNLSN